MARTQSTWEQYAGSYVAVPWAEGRDVLIRGTNKYLNFGSLVGDSGYGIRDNAGTLQFKNAAGSWTNFGSGGGGASWGSITGTLSAQTDLQTALDGKQAIPVVVSGSGTAVNDTTYVNVATATYTDPTPSEGKGFIVFVRNGTATVGGTGYSTAGTIIHRIFHSGAWANYVYQVSSTFKVVGADETANVTAASTSAAGKVELATDAETVTGTDTSRATTPANITARLAAPGTIGGTTPVTRIDYAGAISTVSNLGNLGATETFNWSTATNFTGTLDQNITIDFSNAVSGQTITLYLLYSGAQRTISWTPTIEWGGGTAPTGPDEAGEYLVVTLKYVGTTYFGSFELFK